MLEAYSAFYHSHISGFINLKQFYVPKQMSIRPVVIHKQMKLPATSCGVSARTSLSLFVADLRVIKPWEIKNLHTLITISSINRYGIGRFVMGVCKTWRIRTLTKPPQHGRLDCGQNLMPSAYLSVQERLVFRYSSNALTKTGRNPCINHATASSTYSLTTKKPCSFA